MSRRSDARRRAREARRWDWRWRLRTAVFLVAVVVALLTKNLWADGFDALIGALGDGSTAAAFVGWLAGFAWLAYGLVALVVKRRWAHAFDRTWPLGVLLFMPFLTLQPSRTKRSQAVEDDYWYLGSFFDTYQLAILTVVTAGAVAALLLWWGTRGDRTDPARLDRWLSAAAQAAVAVVAAGTIGTLGWALVGF